MLDAYIIHILTMIAIFAMLGLSYNLLAGFTGLGNLGHPALFLIGAYATVLLHLKLGMPLPLAWAFGAFAGGLAGGILSLLTRRARGDFVSVMTLLALITTVTVALNWIDLTRGALGIPGIPRPATFQSPAAFFVLSLVCLLVVYGFLYRLTISPFGRVLGAVRDDGLGAATLGKNVFKTRVIAFVVAGILAGFGGALYAMFLRFIDPGSFHFVMLISLLAVVYVGGLASLPGTLLGAVLVVVIPEGLRFLPLNPEVVGALRQIIFSVLILSVIIWRPKGILGRVEL